MREFDVRQVHSELSAYFLELVSQVLIFLFVVGVGCGFLLYLFEVNLQVLRLETKRVLYDTNEPRTADLGDQDFEAMERELLFIVLADGLEGERM